MDVESPNQQSPGIVRQKTPSFILKHRSSIRRKKLQVAMPTTPTTTAAADSNNVKTTTQQKKFYIADKYPFLLKTISNGTTTTIDPDAKTKTLSSPSPLSHLHDVHGMPWKTSIDPNYCNNNKQSPYYMPFWEHQLAYMKDTLHSLRQLPVHSKSKQREDMSYIDNLNIDVGSSSSHRKSPTKNPMRMHTLLFTCDEYKLIRMTVIDGGYQTQVYNSVWYPNPNLGNIPILACDLLKFGPRYLCISDYQPIVQQEEGKDNDKDSSDAAFESAMEPIRDQHPELHGQMSGRFYDGDQYFSNQMLLGRHIEKDNDKDSSRSASSSSCADDMVYGSFFTAYESYMKTHINMVQSIAAARKSTSNDATTPVGEETLKLHAAYDTYSVAHDPAHPMLVKAFGKEWADNFVHDILFPLSCREETESSTNQQDRCHDN